MSITKWSTGGRAVESEVSTGQATGSAQPLLGEESFWKLDIRIQLQQEIFARLYYVLSMRAVRTGYACSEGS